MMNFLLLMAFPVAIAIAVLLKWKREVAIWEFGLQLVAPAALVALGLLIASCQSTADTELWNGRVTSKQSLRVSCEHSYPCNCRTVCTSNGKSESCYVVCDTCYEHSYDIDWRVYASSGDWLNIHRIDRQGLKMPPRWRAVYSGEPFSMEHTYTNYILANPDSVLLGGKGDVEKFKALLPKYPEPYDYYKVHRLLNVGGVPVKDPATWDWLLSEVNGDLGPVKQVNIFLLLVKTSDPSYILALKDWWVGGKKNDVVIVVGTLDGHKMEFVDVLTWSTNPLYKVTLRDAIAAHGTLDQRDAIIGDIRNLTEDKFQRMHMKDFKYLMRSFQPSTTWMMVLFVLGVLMTVGVAIWSVINEEYSDNYRGW